MSKRKTTEQFKKEVYDKVKDEYEVMEEYINSDTKILLKHNKCNNLYKVKPKDFLSHNNRCPYCSNNKKKTLEQFKKEVYDKVKDEYTVLGDSYINNKIPILIKHNECGYEFLISPNDFLNHCHRCPYCKGGSKINNKDIFINKLNRFKEYELVSDFIDGDKEVLIRHKNCNNISKEIPNNFFKKKCKCKICYNNKKTNEEFINEIKKLVDINEYIPLSEYTGYRDDFTFKHTKCNKTFTVKPYRFLQGDRCPNCKRSKGEEKIINFLENNNIEYEREYSFKDLYYKSKNHPLRFDFKLQDDSGKIILIEYDGEFHYRNIFYEDGLKEQKLRDKLKDNYCNSHNNIDLYRLTYKDYNNIESILEDIINKY